MIFQVAGQRSPSEIFDDLAEEINGILSHSWGEPPVSPYNKENDRPESAAKDIDLESEETKVVIHTLNDTNVKRKQSIDSVDLMIEEEIKHITGDHDDEKEEKTPKPAQDEDDIKVEDA
jgi:hypothetical protein